MEQAVSKNLDYLPHVLIIDDDDRIRQLVTRFLQDQGFFVVSASRAGEARAVLEYLSFDVMVVDIMMPGETGLSFVQSLREKGCDVPVLFLTALGEAGDRISGFEAGGDDYLSKPFEPRELVLRLQAILRRRPPVEDNLPLFAIGGRRYDADHNELRSGDDVIRLTTVEGNLIRALAMRAGEVVGREDLAALCGMDAAGRTIDVQVTRLRRKLEEDVKAPRYLQTVRGKGYLLRIEEI
ncbi:MAG: response regulator [Rhodospirillales bacterium]|nr:response regulator [Rhodospirillales bacterium]